MNHKPSSLHTYLLELMEIASLNKTIDKKIINQCKKRMRHKKLIKDDDMKNHFCVFFLPIDIQKKKLFLCHHIKANDWIPPGGHIDENELPTQTVIRECKEELSTNISENQIEFFNLSIKQIENPTHSCETHYDIWYLIYLKTQRFNYLKKEYLDAKWVTIHEAKNLIKKNPDFMKIILTLRNTFLFI